MTKDDCQQYLEDPEAHGGHLAECESCRALEATLADAPDARPVSIEALPMAPWEGAAHRSWSLLAAAAIVVGIAAVALMAIAGATPSDIFKGRLGSVDELMSLAMLAGGAVQNAPRPWQVAIVIAFVVVNLVFLALLRRAPKGIDV